MTPLKSLAWLALAAVLAPAQVSAQRGGEITFYSQIAFRGQSYTVSGPRENVRVPFTVRSARLGRGEAWEVCTGARYQGRCNIVNDDQGNIAWTVNSARPARQGPTPPGPPPGNSQSLRGMSAEFFPQPSDRGGRTPSCNSGAAACAAQAADRFCQGRGWTASSYERQETVAGRAYLADVLCTRTR